VRVNVSGGGNTARPGVRHGIARALLQFDGQFAAGRS